LNFATLNHTHQSHGYRQRSPDIKESTAMAKWADYCISAVQYDDTHTRIVSVKAFKDNGDKLTDESTYARQTIVKAIEAGTSLITVTRSTDGKWQKGQPIIVVSINNAKYIKTTNNNTESDNLENLPEF
jgi:hypothetical protein